MLQTVEPVTHMLTGACISRACGLPSRIRYATAACVIAAELPDVDYMYRLGGPLLYFQHHRGWTHALWSLPLQAAFVVFLFWLLHRSRRSWKKHRSKDPVPTRWLALGIMAFVALLSHVFLDWTNSYGVRPFAPWNPHWYVADLVFIVEPLLLLFLALALLLPLLFSLIHREIGSRRSKFEGRGLAIAALVLMAALWGYRTMQHGDAQTVVGVQELRGGHLLRDSLIPYPVNPYRWHVVAETPVSFQSGEIDTRVGVFETDPQQIYAKPAVTASILAAKESWLGRVYLDWSLYPLVEDIGTAAEVHPEMQLSSRDAALRVIRFTDLRFRYDVMGMRDRTHPPLGAEAWVDGSGHVLRAFVGTSEQHLPQ
jgi:inner membrane protein